MTTEAGETEEQPTSGDECPAATTFDADTVNYVQTNLKPAKMIFKSAMFGVDNGNTPTRARATGKVTDNDIVSATTAYVPPACFADAEKALADEYAVVIYGPPDSGKRASSIVLLRERTEGQLVLLSPQLTLTELGERAYRKGFGYAVVDHIGEQNTGELEFTWRVIRERLAKAEAYLVVTTTTAPPTTVAAVQQVAWAPPRPEEVLAARALTPLSEEDNATLTSALTGSVRMRDVVQLADRLAGGECMAAAVEHFDQTAKNKVCEWFDREPHRREILEVTTVSFALGADDRRFESMLAALERRLRNHMPEQESTEEVPQETSLPQRRHSLTGPASLIVRRTVTSDFGPRNELGFTSSSYHRHVLTVLWDRMEVAFWDAMREWFNDIVTVDMRRVAFGLARLAEVTFDEVRTLLVPWSRGARGAQGQWGAILVLSAMVYSDELAPAALQTATMWINSGNAAQRWTAAVTFSGDLGMRFPHEATNRLWQLCTQAHTASGTPSVALAGLFASLASHTPDAGIVLKTLSGKLSRFGRDGGNVVMQSVAMTATLAVLSVQDEIANRRAFLRYLEQFPEHIGTVATLWAAVLRNKPTRLGAIRSLHDALKDIADHRERPAEEAARLGDALANEMTEAEREQLRVDMHRVADRRNTHNNEALTTLLTALLDALNRNGTAKKET